MIEFTYNTISFYIFQSNYIILNFKVIIHK